MSLFWLSSTETLFLEFMAENKSEGTEPKSQSVPQSKDQGAGRVRPNDRPPPPPEDRMQSRTDSADKPPEEKKP